ncbi:MAG: ABC transporter ATP-binding protein [Rhodovibrionaceae bacterium]
MLEISQLHRRFDGGTIALDRVDLAVAESQIVGLVGTSGCGKSTLLRIVAGLDRPSGGEVLIDGTRVTAPRSEIGIVFQEPRLMPWLNVTENIRLALDDYPRREQETRIAEVLERVGLADFAKALPRELSGGMAQRVAIARALVRRPSILLLDEPFSALDSFIRISLQNHLLELWEEARFTMLFVTHDIEEAVALSDRVVAMRGQPGRIHKTLDVALPRPRKRTAVEFQAVKEEILEALNLDAEQAA